MATATWSPGHSPTAKASSAPTGGYGLGYDDINVVMPTRHESDTSEDRPSILTLARKTAEGGEL
jgi:hypothetical protein